MEEQGIPAAVVDLDWLGWTTLRDHAGLMWKNLAAMWPNYVDAGVRYVVMARLMQSKAELEALHHAVPGIDITVVRVDSPRELVEERLRRRDTGRILEEHLRQADEFVGPLQALGIENFSVTNGDRPLREVAHEILDRLRWT